MIPICKVVSIHGLDQRLDQRTNMCMCFCRAPHSYVLFGQFTRFATCTHAEVRENTERCLKNVYILSRPIGSDNSDHEDKPMFSDNSNLPLCNGGYGVIHFVHKPSYQKPPAYQHATSYQKIPVNRLDQWTNTHIVFDVALVLSKAQSRWFPLTLMLDSHMIIADVFWLLYCLVV